MTPLESFDSFRRTSPPKLKPRRRYGCSSRSVGATSESCSTQMTSHRTWLASSSSTMPLASETRSKSNDLDRPAGFSCSATRPIAVRRFRLRGPLDEKDPRGSPISVQELDRGADELVLTGFHIPQIETLDDHHVRSEECLVDGIALLLGALRLDREVVDSDEPDSVRDAPSRGTRVDRCEVACEWCVRIAPAGAIAGLEQDPLGPGRELRAIKPFPRDMSRFVEGNDDAGTDEGVDRQLIRRVPALQEVERGIDVCSSVIADGHDRNVCGVASCDAAERLDLWSRLAGPADHVRP